MFGIDNAFRVSSESKTTKWRKLHTVLELKRVPSLVRMSGDLLSFSCILWVALLIIAFILFGGS